MQDPTDSAAGIETTDEFRQFAQKNDVFTRAFWDPTVRTDKTDAFFGSYRMEAIPRRGDGFTQKDFALRNASWLISDIMTDRHANKGRREGFQAPISNDTPVADEKVEYLNPSDASAEIKKISQFFGSDLCGITHLDKRWLYSKRVDVRDMSEVEIGLPDGLTSVIVLGHQMDKELVQTYPSALGGAATGREYSHEAAIVMQVAAYIRNLGYQAVASMNDTGLVIPMAIQAGLGEYARNQLVITPEFGPRLRFSKIFTDMPLEADKPKRPGVAKFCDICTKCVDACPVKALPSGRPKTGGGLSSIKGVRKWTSDAEKCFSFWATLSTDCAICMRVCPFNRDFSTWSQRIWLKLALSPARRIALWMDRYRDGRIKPSKWWTK
ncbi:MAG: reductive dehalogenase [Planktomarina sp.]|nr:reductive dehalogenase [Planktomarina sp.]MDT2083780.1 reductive dehalogenase [Planktomarina sp.]|tara:strand:+ start:199 stop:1341 length:1143 start_codon:yes stop_codon:yes gene_type:complete